MYKKIIPKLTFNVYVEIVLEILNTELLYCSNSPMQTYLSRVKHVHLCFA